jgi:hypothetical protein
MFAAVEWHGALCEIALDPSEVPVDTHKNRGEEQLVDRLSHRCTVQPRDCGFLLSVWPQAGNQHSCVPRARICGCYRTMPDFL